MKVPEHLGNFIFCWIHFAENFGNFRFLEFFWHLGKALAGIVLASNFSLVGGSLFGAPALQKKPGEKVPAVQHISLDVDDDEDDEHEEEVEDDADDEDENEYEDEFEDDKG